MKRMIALLLLASTLTGCASRDYSTDLNPWIGRSERELVTTWGIPDKQYNLDSTTKLLSYVSFQNVTSADVTTSCIGASPIYHCNRFPSTVRTYSCETVFSVERGKIIRWGRKGNNC